MAAKDKRLCKWSHKDIDKHFKSYTDLVKKPKYVCLKCGRVAKNKSLLHEPAKI